MKMVRIYEGCVAEVLQIDGSIVPEFHPDMTWVDVTDSANCPEAGWVAIKVNGIWSFSAPAIPEPTDSELKAAAIAKRDSLLSLAREATAGMSDAYIAGLLDADDTARFKAFAAYQLVLNKIDQQTGYPASIDWPDSP